MPALASTALVSGATIRLKATRHGLMVYCVHDEIVGRSLDLYGEFAYEETLVFDRLIKPGMTALDVGANIGAHTLDFARAVGAAAGTVIAFEPQGFLHQMLCTNLLLNEIFSVRAIHGGIGREEGKAFIPPIDYAAAGNFGGVSLQAGSGGEPVMVMPLDRLRLAQCHFIKIDVEGMEEEVIAGAAQTIRTLRPILYVENDRREKSAALIERIWSLDYTCFWHFPRYYNPDNVYGNGENVFGGMVSVNMICVPRGSGLDLGEFERVTDTRTHPIDSFKTT